MTTIVVVETKNDHGPMYLNVTSVAFVQRSGEDEGYPFLVELNSDRLLYVTEQDAQRILSALGSKLL
jgi:hypothetical protein